MVLPQPRHGLRYLVMVQGGLAGHQPHLERPDVEVSHLEEPGVARSRSAVLDQCASPLLLFMDDDIALDLEGVVALARYMDARPELSMVAGVLEHNNRRRDMTREKRMRHWNTARSMTPEIMIRIADVRASGVRFDPDFGLKGTYPIGDEFVFMTDLLKAGCRGMWVPIRVGSHPGNSTGDLWVDPVIQDARRAALRRVFGGWAPVIKICFAAKHQRRLGGWAAALRFILEK